MSVPLFGLWTRSLCFSFCKNKRWSKNKITEGRRSTTKWKLQKIMKCLGSGDQLQAADKMDPYSESLASKDYSACGYSSQAREIEKKLDTGNIEEAELSLRESGFLNYEEASALLGRYEYHKGNIEVALHVFEGINIGAVTPKMNITLAKRGERHKRHSQHCGTPPMLKEAAQSCKVILDIVESSLPKGLPENFTAECKLQETLSKAVELLPELWKLSDSPLEAILSYRRALLYQWNLDVETNAKIQKEFAIFLLYIGGEASPPNLCSQMDSSFVLRNNVEEAILLLMILLRKISLNIIKWDPSILDHLSFALSISGHLSLSLCYYGAGEDLVALNLLRKLLTSREDPKCVPALLMASKISWENPGLAEEGVSFARRALENLEGRCNQLGSLANFLLGVSLSSQSRSAVSDSERFTRQSEALQAFETAGKMIGMRDPIILYHLSLENADQGKLDSAIHYAKYLLNVEAGSKVKGWLVLAQILSAQKRFLEAETIINAALNQTVQTKSFGSGKMLHKDIRKNTRSFELEIWHDLAYVYINLSMWHDVEVCLSKSKAIKSYSASRRLGNRSHAIIRSFLMDALRLDRMNASAWYNLGLFYKSEGMSSSVLEATECFEAATILQECAPVEPFR
ncbi:tetratricopeptide repeat protein 7A-like [Quillaja saponaria]|uniref:Tetratricopeptide repeat protein 7A-like n=1 Tax=Quillaja saponaria TaxID=32244 RepID=A0AAD7Q0I3_QUISA|nr:tetratricopeptide repeat protein 7A-like [Quillaja saponaria]